MVIVVTVRKNADVKKKKAPLSATGTILFLDMMRNESYRFNNFIN